ncbi:ATPase, T2SS/T4P/T4SS family [Nannocystaceae bacterium ST9]
MNSPLAFAALSLEQALAQLPVSRFAATQRPVHSSASHPPRAAAEVMLAALDVRPGQHVLHVGIGSGYLSALIAAQGGLVHGVDRLEGVITMVRERLQAFGLSNFRAKVGEGKAGWPEYAPFDRILITARGVAFEGLLEQLGPNGVLVALRGEGTRMREAVRVHRSGEGTTTIESLGPITVGLDFADTLLRLGLITPEQASRARALAKSQRRPLQDVVLEQTHLDERDIYRVLAQHADMPHQPASTLLETLDLELANVVPRSFLEHHDLLPIGLDREGRLLVATTSPHAAIDELASAFPGKRLQAVLVSPPDLRRLWSAVDLQHGDSNIQVESPSDEDVLQGESEALEGYATGLFDALLLDAVGERASDIHLERYGDRVRVRLRVDGDLHDQPRFMLTPSELVALVNVIKVRARIDIAERRLPQGGRIRLHAGGARFDLRVQTQPSLHGEHVVIRLLPQDTQSQTIEDLGFPSDIADAYRRLLDSPSGMVLVVGPTGSGKSTTLYAGLRKLAADARRKVITVEDPIEYSIADVQQTQVQPRIGFAFADAMRAFVREDPDVILIGEIRDGETALEAIRASQTGHLVLSTLHCNDAVDAVQRLYDLGMHPNSIASELLAVLSQRLAKRICTDCRVQTTPDPGILAELFPKGAPAQFVCFEGTGCARCGGHGTRGRIGVVEFLRANADIRRAIGRQPALDDLRAMALAGGLHPLRDALLVQIHAGIVPLSEARRLLQAEAMAGH